MSWSVSVVRKRWTGERTSALAISENESGSRTFLRALPSPCFLEVDCRVGLFCAKTCSSNQRAGNKCKTLPLHFLTWWLTTTTTTTTTKRALVFSRRRRPASPFLIWDFPQPEPAHHVLCQEPTRTQDRMTHSWHFLYYIVCYTYFRARRTFNQCFSIYLPSLWEKTRSPPPPSVQIPASRWNFLRGKRF